jgi:AraC-like DNA-binding protein
MLIEQLRKFSTAILSDETTIYIPSLKGHWEKIPGSIFHFEMEIFFQMSGGCIFDFPEQRIVINQGEALLIPPGIPHKETAFSHSAEPFRNLVIVLGDYGGQVHIAQSVRRQLSTGITEQPYPAYLEKLSSLSLYPALIETVNKNPADNPPEVQTVLRRLVSCLLLQILLDPCTPAILDTEQSGDATNDKIRHFKVAMAQKIIHEHIMSQMPTVTEIAGAVNFTPNYLSSLFHKTTGVTIKNYINILKLDYAHKLIETTTSNISEIAWSCGFQDDSYFAKIFKKRFNIFPAAVRNNNRKTIAADDKISAKTTQKTPE